MFSSQYEQFEVGCGGPGKPLVLEGGKAPTPVGPWYETKGSNREVQDETTDSTQGICIWTCCARATVAKEAKVSIPLYAMLANERTRKTAGISKKSSKAEEQRAEKKK